MEAIFCCSLLFCNTRVQESNKEQSGTKVAAQNWMRSFHVAVEESLYPCHTQKQ
jgi:hypothetical protein